MCIRDSVYAKRFMSRLDISPLALSTYQIGTALCVLALITPYAELQNIGSDRLALLGLVVGLGLTGTGIAYVLYYYIIQQMGAVRASTVTYLPVSYTHLDVYKRQGQYLRTRSYCSMDAIWSSGSIRRITSPRAGSSVMTC